MSMITNVRFPTSPFIEPVTGRPAREWIIWLQSPQFFQIQVNQPLGISSGGTGLSTAPTNGQLLIGNGGIYSLGTLTPGVGISVVNGAGSITVSNTGVLSFSAGTTGLTPATATTGNVVLAGVLKEVNGGTNNSSYATGDLLYASATNTLSKLPKPSATSFLTMDSAGAPAWKNPKYGSFFDTTAQAAAANTPTPITINTTSYSNGVSIGSPTSRVVVNTAGLYNIQFSIQFVNTDTSEDDVFVWLRINGNNLADSNSRASVPRKRGSTNGHLILALNLFYQFAANDYFELVWMTVGGTSSLETIPASTVAPIYPRSPSIILTVNNNIAA
jgi:hypothetical protein